MCDKLYTRAFEFEVRAINDEERGHRLVGRPIVYNQRTDMGHFDEIIDQGALNATDLKDVRFLVNHNTDMIPLARSRNNTANSTMQMSVDAQGMEIRVNLDTENNKDSRALYSAVERGDITGMSFMFQVDEDRWEGLDSDHPTRHITSIGRLYEVSAVTFPAYEQTSIEARSAVLESAKAEALESARAEALVELRKKIKQKGCDLIGDQRDDS